MTNELQDKVAIVTGGAQGIGLGIARRLAAAGSAVVLTDVREDKLGDTVAALKAEGIKAVGAVADVANSSQVAAMAETALSNFGRIDILVNNAGGSGYESIEHIEDLSEQIWLQVINANLTGTFLCSKAVMPTMKAQGSGRIINVSSTVARGYAGPTLTVGARLAYASAKAGIEGFTRQLAKDVYPSGVTVNAIVPGFIMTEPGARMHERFQTIPEQYQAAIMKQYNGEPATPADLGDLALYIALARTVSGQAFPIGVIS